MKRDVFICHALADREEYVEKLIEAFHAHCIDYWIDTAEIQWGESITRKINEGLASSRYVLVLLTPAFMARQWPQAELASALNLETTIGETAVLPVLIGNDTEVFATIPLLRDKLYLRWEEGTEKIAEKLGNRLGKQFKKEWSHCHPAEYSGKVWIRLLAKPVNRGTEHVFQVRWGPWQFEDKLLLEKDPKSLWHMKANDGLSIPIFFTIKPACHVIMGTGEPLDTDPVDINHGWTKVE